MGSVPRKSSWPGWEVKSVSEKDFIILIKPLQVKAFEPVVVFQTLHILIAASMEGYWSAYCLRQLRSASIALALTISRPGCCPCSCCPDDPSMALGKGRVKYLLFTCSLALW